MLVLVVVLCVGFGGWMYLTPNMVRNGDTEMLLVMHMLEGTKKLPERREGRGDG